jgi:hypothetical protein
VVADLLDRAALAQLFAQHRIAAVMHFNHLFLAASATFLCLSSSSVISWMITPSATKSGSTAKADTPTIEAPNRVATERATRTWPSACCAGVDVTHDSVDCH